MRATYEIILHKMVNGRYVHDANDIAVIWDKKSFWLKDNVEFHIILVEQLPDGKEKRTDVTDAYNLNISNMQGHPNKDNTLITFENVRIRFGRQAELANVREQVIK